MSSDFQIIIPMSGVGSRFLVAGFEKPKPLIKIFDKSMIDYVLQMFPGEDDIICIVNREHVKEFAIDEHVMQINSQIKVVCIEPHKYGPVHAVLAARDLIDQNKKVVVNYCDFSMVWDWNKVKRRTEDPNIDGIIPAYKGFHPHSGGKTNYAYIKQTSDMKVVDVQEKKPFTAQKTEEYASTGTYIFKSGALMLEIFDQVISSRLAVNGEYYCSAAFSSKFAKNLNYFVEPIDYFFQWGTPEDLTVFLRYVSNLKKFKAARTEAQQKKTASEVILLPMAGLGARFSNAGYSIKKPLLEFDKYGPLFSLAASSFGDLSNLEVCALTNSKNVRDDALTKCSDSLKSLSITSIQHLTNGQASSTKLLVDEHSTKLSNTHFHVAPCDAYIDACRHSVSNLFQTCGVIVWVKEFTVDSVENPEQYSWMDNSSNMERIFLKQKPDGQIAYQFTGFFSFKCQKVFNKLFDELIRTEQKINNEYYIDTMAVIAQKHGIKVTYCKVDNFICWGTPYEFETNSYFERSLNAEHKIL